MLNANCDFSMDLMFNYVAKTGNAGVWGGKFLSLPAVDRRGARLPGYLDRRSQRSAGADAAAIISRFYLAVKEDILNEPSWETKLARIVDAQWSTWMFDHWPWCLTWALVLFEKRSNERGSRGRARRLVHVWPNLTVFF